MLVRCPSRLGCLFEELVPLPIAIPGLVIALALITTYGGFGDFRQHWTFILVGHVLYTLPFMMRVVMAVLASIDIKTLEEGAISIGAPAHRRFVNIVLPNIRNGILAGALMVVTLLIGEFNLTWMLHTPSTKTLPVGLADSYVSMRLEVASAYTLVFFFMIIPCSSRLTWHQLVQSVTSTRQLQKTEMEMDRNDLACQIVTSITLRDCAKIFSDGTVALKPISLDVVAGETVVILGPSGCGNTTVLSIIAGLTNPDAGGNVLFGDDNVTRVPIKKRNVGMCFQSYATVSQHERSR